MEAYQVFLKTKLFVKASCVDPRKTLFVGTVEKPFSKGRQYVPTEPTTLQKPCRKIPLLPPHLAQYKKCRAEKSIVDPTKSSPPFPDEVSGSYAASLLSSLL